MFNSFYNFFIKNLLNTKPNLASILAEYQAMAEANPDLLRQKIPADEVWRFYIDGNKQPTGRDLRSGLYFQSITTQNIVDPRTYTINEYKIKQENIEPAELENSYNASDLHKFLGRKEWRLTEDELAHFTLMDLLHLDKAWLPFERTEPGYLKALYQAHQQLFNFTQALNVAFIKQLHDLATDQVENLNTEKNSLKESEFRGQRIHFGLTDENATVKGLAAVLKNNNPKIVIEIGFFGSKPLKITQEFLTKLRSYYQLHQKLDGFPFAEFCEVAELKAYQAMDMADSKLINKLAQTIDDQEAASYLHKDFTDNKKYGHYYLIRIASLDNDHDKRLTQALEKLIENFNTAIKAAVEAHDKLKLIVAFIQDCEHLHPFADANCRTFCMLLLNHLLMKHSFPPAILADPNRFDAFSNAELVEEVIQGMQNTLTLIKEGQLFNVNTDAVVNYLASKPYLKPSLDYFKQTVAIETQARSLIEENAVSTTIKPNP